MDGMAEPEKKPKPDPAARKPKKPGPEAERLRITGDPLATFDRMVAYQPPKRRASRKRKHKS
jgi:hypothetical protein